MPKYKIGDTKWYATYDKHASTSVPCPVCFGKLRVIVVLGNGDEVSVPCNYCGHGFKNPTGTIQEYKKVAKAIPFHITGISFDTCGGKEVVEYRMVTSSSGSCSSWIPRKEHQLYDTEEEALIEAERLKNEDETNENTKAEYIKYDKIKSFSWNAGYHMRQIKDAQKQIEYHSQKAVLCKARSKGTPDLSATGSELREPYDTMITNKQIDEELGRKLAALAYLEEIKCV